MKVWFSIVPGHGHLYPLLPLANALRAGGHDVTFCTSAAFSHVIAQFGFGTIAVGPDYTQQSAKGDAVTPDEVNRTVARKMFVEAPPQVLSDLMGRLAHNRPDVMLLDPWERAGFVAAEAAGVPHGAVILGVRTGTLLGQLPFDIGERDRLYAEQVTKPDERLRDIAGIGPHDRWRGEARYDRTLALDMAPPSLQPWPHTWNSHTSHPLRPETHVSGGDHSWLTALEPATPTIAISFGTLFGTPELYERSAAAALAVGAQVIVVSNLAIPLHHERLVTVPWASLDVLLARTDVFVHHGGWGTTIAALSTGTPSVIVPLGSDQFLNAVRVCATGAGVTVSSDSGVEDLAAAIRRTLVEEAFALNAIRLRTEIEAMPPAAEVVGLVERLAANGGPVLNR